MYVSVFSSSDAPCLVQSYVATSTSRNAESAGGGGKNNLASMCNGKLRSISKKLFPMSNVTKNGLGFKKMNHMV